VARRPTTTRWKLISAFFSSLFFFHAFRRKQHHIHSSSGGQQMALCGHWKGQHSHCSHGLVYVKWLHHPLEQSCWTVSTLALNQGTCEVHDKHPIFQEDLVKPQKHLPTTETPTKYH
jgi:hypothetical protein